MPEGISPKTGKPYTVIIAENSTFQARMLRQIFESEGYQIVGIAESGRKLIDLYKEHKKTDIIAMEINLPVVDGYAAFWEIKDLGPLPRIVFVTEENTPAVMRSLIDNGAADYLVKPFKREKLLEKTHVAIQKIHG